MGNLLGALHHSTDSDGYSCVIMNYLSTAGIVCDDGYPMVPDCSLISTNKDFRLSFGAVCLHLQ